MKDLYENCIFDFNTKLCEKCRNPCCKEGIWLFEEEIKSLLENGIPVLKTKDAHFLSLSNPCKFYNTSCKIYRFRPFICRLYPFDILEIGNKLHIIIHTDCPLFEKKDIQKYKEFARKLKKELIMHIKEIKNVFKTSKKPSYKDFIVLSGIE